MKRLSLLSAIAAILLIACNEIDNVGFDMESAVDQQMVGKTHSINVTQNEASGIADMFMCSYVGSDMSLTKSADTKRISSSATVREDGQDLMYVFNYEDGGFVIVGSTRNYYPILAYSDKGSFVLQDDMGPVAVWLDETKVSIKNSSSLDAATKAQMQNLWSHYDGTYVDPAQQLLASRRPQTRSAGEDACWNRIDSLQQEHGSEGWTFLPVSFVEDLFTDLNLDSYYDAICYCAEQNRSALNETVIGYRYPAVNQVGPLLSTTWHQYSPYNDSCTNQYPAGCAVIAAAQVMKYHEYPSTFILNGTSFTWSDIPVSPSSLPNKIPQFIYGLGVLFNTTYGYYESSSPLLDVFTGLFSLGYYVHYDENNDEATYRYRIMYDQNPVIMYGWKSNASSASGHAWVCDGVRQAVYNQLQFFTENQPDGAGEFFQGMYTYSNPGLIGQPVGSPIYTYHMNWGMTTTSYNGWFSANYTFSNPLDYNYLRNNMCPALTYTSM